MSRRMIVAALVLMASIQVVGCADSSGPRVRASAVVGTWTAAVSAKAGCWPAFTYSFEVTPADIEGRESRENVIITGGDWYIGETGPMLYTGTIWLNGQASTLKFWKQPVSAGGSVTATLTDDGTTMSGTFVDQGHAFALANGCSAALVATKD